MVSSSSTHADIMFYAFRYALGRQTYVTQVVADYLVEHWDEFASNDQAAIQKEIWQAIDREKAGNDIDIVNWRQILELPVRKLGQAEPKEVQIPTTIYDAEALRRYLGNTVLGEFYHISDVAAGSGRIKLAVWYHSQPKQVYTELMPSADYGKLPKPKEVQAVLARLKLRMYKGQYDGKDLL